MGSGADDLKGKWSSDWGQVTLDVDGAAVTGKWAEGTLSGTVEGDTLSLVWTHKAAGNSGKAKLKADKDFAVLTGTWGHDDDSSGGAWELKQTERTAPPKPKPAPKPEPKPEPEPQPEPEPKPEG